MTRQPFTIIDEDRATEVDAVISANAVRLPAESLEAALGWKLEGEGLCKDGICMSPGEPGELVSDEGVDLARLAARLERPLVLDGEAGAAALGACAGVRARAMATLKAPQFTLPDLDGKPHALSDYRGKKILLVAWASW